MYILEVQYLYRTILPLGPFVEQRIDLILLSPAVISAVQILHDDVKPIGIFVAFYVVNESLNSTHDI